MPKKLFIDGRTGTAAQKITSVLAPFVRAGAVEVIEVESHRDLGQRMAAMAASDLAVLCTHDDVSRKNDGRSKGERYYNARIGYILRVQISAGMGVWFS
jgi:hypothetical protein